MQATIEQARLDSDRFGLASQFDDWLSDRRLHRASDLEIAHALWSAGATISRIREESEANGTLQGLDAWLAKEAEGKLDVQLAAELADARDMLQGARALAQKNGREEAFQTFIDAARSEGKPDIVIHEEWMAGQNLVTAGSSAARGDLAAVQEHFLQELNERRAQGPRDPYALPSSESEGEPSPPASSGAGLPPPPEPIDARVRPTGLASKLKRDTLDLSRLARRAPGALPTGREGEPGPASSAVAAPPLEPAHTPAQRNALTRRLKRDTLDLATRRS